MKNKKIIISRIEELSNFDWLWYVPAGGDIVYVNDEKSVAEAAKLWGITPEAVNAIKEALGYMAETFVDHVKADLVDIWKEVTHESN